MAELTYSERLQPSLLDRLTDDAPDSQSESRQQRIMSVRQLRSSVIRDLEWLLNAAHLEAVIDMTDVPQVKSSVVNYGRTALSGVTSSGAKASELERRLTRCIQIYEPRILAETLSVTLIANDDGAERNTLALEIDGQLWAQPMPLSLFLRTEIDLETGEIQIVESPRA